MPSASRFDPMKELANLRDQVNKVIGDTIGSSSFLPVDIYETEDSVVIVTAPLLGLKTETLDIAITEGHLTISGETANPLEVDDRQYLRRERKFGPFSRSVPVSGVVDPEKARAEFKNQVLTIYLPKLEISGPKVIKVKPVV
ncbi:MAG: Hsp20/alpha crystallin family protein [Anaerolineae bacterium]|nr:Hsp20/alpha crystallin family protein [Anaerolineae bacterium]